MKASYLKPGDVILVSGERAVVRAIEHPHKDAATIKLRGRKPLYLRWDDEVEVAP